MSDDNVVEQRKQHVLALLSENRHAEALNDLAWLCEQLPLDPNVWFVRGQALLQLQRAEQAIECFRRLVELTPKSVDAYFSLGMAQGVSNYLDDAQSSFETVLRLDSKNHSAYMMLGTVLQKKGKLNDAVKHLHKAKGPGVNPVELNIRLGRAYLDLAENDKAQTYFKKAYKLQPKHPEALSGMAAVYAYRGDVKKAYEYLAPCLRAEPISITAASTLAGICRKLGRCDEAVNVLELCLASSAYKEDQSRIHFELGRLLDRAGDYRKAFRHIKKANELAARSYDPWDEALQFSDVIKRLDRDFFKHAPRATKRNKNKRPIFIVGMPRSGTTLVEQILASHPSVFGAGELTLLSDLTTEMAGESHAASSYVDALMTVEQATLNQYAGRYLKYIASVSPDSAKVVTDKMPDNYRLLGMINLLFPKARIIQCVREPLDNCLSCYFQNFSSGHLYSYDLKNLGLYYNLYRSMMANWKQILDVPIMELKYERLVEDPEPVIRSLLEHCRLNWSDKCLEFHKSKRDVITASHDQVRRPMYKSSLGRWENYREEIEPLREGLAQSII